MRAILTQVIDPRPLAAARILVGLVSLGFTFEWIRVLVRASSGKYLAMPVIAGWPPPAPELVWALVGLSLGASTAMVLGLAGRLPAVTIALTTAAVLLADQQTYSNHMVLLMMLALFLGASGSANAWALPRRFRPAQVPYWPVFLIKVQITTLYAWTAVAKVNPQYLSGEVLGEYLHSWAPIPDNSLSAVAVLSVATEAFLSISLWIPKAQKVSFVVGAGLHIGIVVLLGSPAPLIGFGMLMLSGYVLFAWGEVGPGPAEKPSRQPIVIAG